MKRSNNDLETTALLPILKRARHQIPRRIAFAAAAQATDAKPEGTSTQVVDALTQNLLQNVARGSAAVGARRTAIAAISV